MVIIRPFQASDRQPLLTIGAETAFFGAPIEAYLEDRRIFQDAFYAYYTDYEPQHTWIASDGDRIAGFLTGCIDTAQRTKIMQRRIIPAVVWKLVRGTYKLGPKTWQYARSVAGAWRRREFPVVDEKAYPAHLHINLLSGWRGQGVGRRLMETYLNQLVELSIPAVHLHTNSMNEAACKLYEKLGFQLLDARQTRMYEYLVGHVAENRSYGLRF